ncbi:MAG: AAA family ATPase, partial [Pseudomonadota bacterium]
GDKTLQIDGVIRQNAGIAVGETVEIKAAQAQDAESLTFSFPGRGHYDTPAAQKRLITQLQDIPLSSGDHIRLRMISGGDLVGKVVSTTPSDGPVFAKETTRLSIRYETRTSTASQLVSYEDLGGLSLELGRVREMIELPFRRPDIFQHLGIDAPKGVLLSGPPGTGKTLLAKAVAQECDATFYQINGPEIVSKHYGDSEKQLRAVFQQAESKAPSIIFIDELDAIAPKRESLNSDRQLERRIVAQLLTLMDGMNSRGHVIVLASTNLPDTIDPALRRPGRFDREITFGVPDRNGRLEILKVHTRGMPLAENVDLEELARVTHGFVGADIAALCREAGMAVLRSFWKMDSSDISNMDVQSIKIDKADFDTAMRDVRPSALREISTDIPDTRWSDIGGLEDIKQTLIESVIWPLKHQQLFENFALEPTKGVLLAGQPGTGKTLLAKALAHEAEINFISVRGSQLLNQFLGESEKAIREVFTKARAAAPSIVFFDELDALAPKRGGTQNSTLDQIVAQLLTEIDGMTELKGVFMLGATNRVDCIDPALLRPGRFDYIIEMPVPDKTMRVEILKIHTRDMPLSRDIDFDGLANMTDGFVGADLKLLCQISSRIALKCMLEMISADDRVSHDGEQNKRLHPIDMTSFQHAFAILENRKNT